VARLSPRSSRVSVEGNVGASTALCRYRPPAASVKTLETNAHYCQRAAAPICLE
jgi:hypothetical protein